eukprot:g11747.t1
MNRFDAAPTLETERLRLRAHAAEDFAATRALWSDPAVVRLITGRPASGEEAWARLVRYAGHWRLLGFGYWLVETKTEARFVGEVGLADYRRALDPPRDGVPEAGWVLTPAAQGRGFAGEAVAAALAWADDRLSAPETFCMIHPENAASIRVAERAGYRRDATGLYGERPTLFLTRPKGG